MSQLVEWEPTKYECLFDSREQMQSTLDVSRKTLGQWIVRKLIGIEQKAFLERLLVTHDQKVFANSKKGQKYEIDPLYLEQRNERAKIKLNKRKVQMSEEILKGATFEALSISMGVARTSMYKILQKAFTCTSIPLIRKELESKAI